MKAAAELRADLDSDIKADGEGNSEVMKEMKAADQLQADLDSEVKAAAEGNSREMRAAADLEAAWTWR